jgi:hypothetical protein
MTASKVIERLLYWQPHCFAQLPLVRERCVLATRVGIDVLARFGIAAEPLPVMAAVCNQKYERWRQFIDPLPVDDAKLIPPPADGWAVMSGLPPDEGEAPRPKHWHGHLIVSVPAKGMVLDLDFQAFGRPEKGLDVGPAVGFPWPAGALCVDLMGLDRANRPIFLHYQHTPENQGYVTGPDWQRNEFNQAAVRAIERAIRKGGQP